MGGVRIRLEVDDRAGPWLKGLAERDLPVARRELVRNASREALSQTIRLNPVDTGRSRAAWVAALQQLGGNAPPGREGSDPVAMAEGSGLGSAEISDQEPITEAIANSRVRYAGYLEYGTSKLAAFAMVRRALAGVQQRLARLFRFPREGQN